MHGQIGQRQGRIEDPRDLESYYRTRATLFDAQCRLAAGAIDYEFYRLRARAERNRMRSEVFQSLLRLIRPLIGIALIAGAIWIMPLQARDCVVCDAPAAHVTNIP
jgi:hypothetical protein